MSRATANSSGAASSAFFCRDRALILRTRTGRITPATTTATCAVKPTGQQLISPNWHERGGKHRQRKQPHEPAAAAGHEPDPAARPYNAGIAADGHDEHDGRRERVWEQRAWSGSVESLRGSEESRLLRVFARFKTNVGLQIEIGLREVVRVLGNRRGPPSSTPFLPAL